MIVLQIRFRYARSEKGEPVVTFPMVPGSNIRDVVGDSVRLLEDMGREYHGCQSMPSLCPDDYELSAAGKTIENLDDLPVAEVMSPYPMTRGLDLRYVGPFGDFQRDQCLRLGGKKSLEYAQSEIHPAGRVG